MNTDTCEICVQSETCNKDNNRIHCNLLDRSFDRDAWCEKFERDFEKTKEIEDE